MKNFAVMTTIEKLNTFVNQRAGLEFANYGDVRLYRSESREITRDRSDYYELLGRFVPMLIKQQHKNKMKAEVKTINNPDAKPLLAVRAYSGRKWKAVKNSSWGEKHGEKVALCSVIGQPFVNQTEINN